MEYLVTMTTHVPDGTPEQVVDDVRAREAAHSGDLAAEGQLLRLWRPPLQPGEWRTLGLFAAGDAGQLQQALASMPLRIWRTDQVMPLAPHPSDPARAPGQARQAPSSWPPSRSRSPMARPAGPSKSPRRARPRARELAGQGHLERLWILPGQGRALGVYRARDSAEMEAIVKSLPLDPWMTTELTPLTPHPSDPATTST